MIELKRHTIGRWHYVLTALAVAPDYLRNRHGPCPGCGGTDRFRFDDKDGRGTFFCGGGGEPVSGDGFTLLNHVYGWDFKTTAKEVRKVLGIASEKTTLLPANVVPITKPKVSKTQLYAESLWKSANSDDGYVASHPYCVRKGIKWACGASRGPASGRLVGGNADCLIVSQTTLQGTLIGVECINPEGVKQSFGKKGVLMLGNTLNKSLPLYIVEGWADAVSAWMLFGDVVVIAVFGKNQQDKVTDEILAARPQRNIIIVRDSDAQIGNVG